LGIDQDDLLVGESVTERDLAVSLRDDGSNRLVLDEIGEPPL
jgi:hypothetical protein